MHSQERACGHWCKLTNLVSPALGAPYPFYISLRAESTTHPDQYLQTILPRQYWIILNWSVHQTVIQVKKDCQPICSSCLMPEHVLVSGWGFVTLCHTENWTWWAPSPVYHLPLNIEWSGMGDEIEDSGGAQGEVPALLHLPFNCSKCKTTILLPAKTTFSIFSMVSSRIGATSKVVTFT